MDKRFLTVNYKGAPCYNIYFSADFLELPNLIKSFDVSDKQICIVTDSNVGPLYADKVMSILNHLCRNVIIYEIPAGENHKNVDSIYGIYEVLIENHFDRKDMLIALGGGVIGDMTGFAAASYLRGIDFIQMPTTLLSQVDSSIGGKTGVDFKSYKNMVGAFHMPRLVYINLSVLTSLKKRDYLSGMGEIIKHGLIKDAKYFDWLGKNYDRILNKDYNTLEQMVYRSCDIKRMVVEKDPEEKGERALLNFGHTIGHSIEKERDFSLLHGECVSIGITAASYISLKKGYITRDILNEIENTLLLYDLPVRAPLSDANKVLEYTLNDKKMESGVIKFISLASKGKAFIDRSVTRDEMLDAINYIKGAKNS